MTETVSTAEPTVIDRLIALKDGGATAEEVDAYLAELPLEDHVQAMKTALIGVINRLTALESVVGDVIDVLVASGMVQRVVAEDDTNE